MKYTRIKLSLIIIFLLNSALLAVWNFIYTPLSEIKGFDLLKTIAARELMGPELFSSYISENQNKIDVIHYDLNIELYPEDKLIEGEILITGIVKNSKLNKIDLNFYDNFKIEKITVNGKSADYDNNDTKLIIESSVELTDTFKVFIKYEGTPVKAGLASFSFDEYNNKPVIFSLSEPIYASTWFPCNDKPDDKALLDIKITNDSSSVSVSNGVLKGITNKGKRRTYHWETLYPISTYLICLYSAEYKNAKQQYVSVSGDTLELEYYAYKDHFDKAVKDFSVHPDILSFMENTFGEYPFIKEKYGVAVFQWQYGAMEHQTITGIGSNFINGSQLFSEFYIHELAHQWWGNAVGPKSWKDIWLNEGFSTYSEALYAEYTSGFDALKSTMFAKYSDGFNDRLYDPQDNLFSSTVYDKGAWVLHMLRKEVGDSSFFKILKTYYKEFKYKNASTSDFISVCKKITGNDLTDFFEQWVYKGKGIIDLSYKWSCTKKDDGFVLNINFEQNQSDYPEYKFPLDIKVNFNDNQENFVKNIYIDKRNYSLSIPVNEKVLDIQCDPDNWLLAVIKNNNSGVVE